MERAVVAMLLGGLTNSSGELKQWAAATTPPVCHL
jgi:hypothetical protein